LCVDVIECLPVTGTEKAEQRDPGVCHEVSCGIQKEGNPRSVSTELHLEEVPNNPEKEQTFMVRKYFRDDRKI